MSTEQSAATKPSKIAITKLLAEAEVARRRAIKPWLLAFLLPLLVGAALIGFSSYAVYVRLQQIKGQDEQIKANEQRIQGQKEELEALNVQLQGTKDLASAALAKLPNAEAKEVIAATAASNPGAAATTPRVFIQIHDEEQRKKAADVAQALKSAGLIVPGIEKRADVKVDGNQVKYFRQEDKGVADKVDGVLTGQGVAGVRTVLTGGFKVPPGQIEIWFAPAPPPTPTPTPIPTPSSRGGRRGRAAATNMNANVGGEMNSNMDEASGTNVNTGGNANTGAGRRRGGRRGTTNSNSNTNSMPSQP